jgi:hypothetical protein
MFKITRNCNKDEEIRTAEIKQRGGTVDKNIDIIRVSPDTKLRLHKLEYQYKRPENFYAWCYHSNVDFYSKYILDEIDFKPYRHLYPKSVKSYRNWVDYTKIIILVCLFSILLGTVLFQINSAFLFTGAILLFLYSSMGFVCSLLKIKTGFKALWDKASRFDRSTGMVTIFDSKNRIHIELPFQDFIPFYVRSGGGDLNSPMYCLYLGHKAFPLGVTFGRHFFFSEMIKNYVFVKSFMDQSQPLPDVPELELFRKFDSVTYEADKKSNRQADCWSKMTRHKINKLFKIANKEFDEKIKNKPLD